MRFPMPFAYSTWPRGWRACIVAMLAMVASAACPTRAQPAAQTQVDVRADWHVRLAQDGKGSDARGAQLLLLLNGLGGADGVATAQDTVSWPTGGDGDYRIDSVLTPRGALALLLRRLHWVRTASGSVTDGRPTLLAASNRKGDNPTTEVHIEHGQLLVRTAGEAASAAPPASQAAPPGLTDPLTLTWGYVQRTLPRKPFDVPLLINDAVQDAHITPQRVTLRWQGLDVPCVLLDARSAQSSATLRIWLRQSDGLPLQVVLGMGDRYGLDVVQTLATVPAGWEALQAARHTRQAH